MHGLDTGAVDLGHIGRVDEHERRHAPKERRVRDARELERRRAEAEDVDDEDRRNPAEEVGVEHGEQPEREKHRPGQPPKHSDREGEDEDQRLGGTEDPNVQQESVRDLRKRVAEELSVEESLADLWPARGGNDDDDDDRKEHDRAGDGDSDVAGPSKVAQDPRPAVAAAGFRIDAHAATGATSGRERSPCSTATPAESSQAFRRSSAKRAPCRRKR